MKLRLLLSLSSLLTLLFAAPLAHPASGEIKRPAAENEILGVYWFPDRTGQVEILRQGDEFVGLVLSYDVPDQLDENNPDPNLRTRPFVRIEMFSDFHFETESQRWVDGTVYDGASGNTYKGYLWFDSARPRRLLARGYIGISLFGRTEEFMRVAPNEIQRPPLPRSAAPILDKQP